MQEVLPHRERMDIWNQRIVWRWLPAICLAIGSPASAQVSYDDTGKSAWVDLTRIGKAQVQFSAGKHRATVTLTVERTPAGWPGIMRIGPAPADIRSSHESDRMVTEVELQVDGCLIDQPWPPISGMAMPNAATLSFAKGQWQLDVSGGDGAELYGITYVFDGRRVLTRDLDWYPGISEKTRYDIDNDPDIAPQLCRETGGRGRSRRLKGHG